jgi:uncharacterized membrane protein
MSEQNNQQTQQTQQPQQTQQQYQQPQQQQYQQPQQQQYQQQYQQPPYQQGYQQPNQFSKFTNTADYTGQYHPQDIADNKIYAILSYFGFLFFIPLVAAPQSRYGRFHANQGLLLFILEVAVGIVTGIIGAIIPWQLYWLQSIISLVFWVPEAVLFIIGLMNAINGKAKELPIIGKYRIIK